MIQAVINRSDSAEEKIRSQVGPCGNFVGTGSPQVLLLYLSVSFHQCYTMICLLQTAYSYSRRSAPTLINPLKNTTHMQDLNTVPCSKEVA
jgi:hypothetical protein